MSISFVGTYSAGAWDLQRHTMLWGPLALLTETFFPLVIWHGLLDVMFSIVTYI